MKETALKEKTTELKPCSLREKIAVFCVGVLTQSLLVYGFDYVLYPAVIWKMGPVNGGIVMVFLTFVDSYRILRLYDWSKRDWLGIEALKEAKKYKGTIKAGRRISWALKKSDPFAVVILSFIVDPFIVVLYMRHENFRYNGLAKRDWTIFLTSLAIGSIYWTLACYMGITLFEWVWRKFIGLSGI